jgi:heme-degrading monooxygenase HmoA
MSSSAVRRMVAAMVSSAFLSSCAIATPWPRLKSPSAEQGNELVVLVLTRVVLDASRRQEFDRQNSLVLASMGSHPGLLGYAARKQVFGDQGWTMSVWANDAARAAFVRSAVHREAIAKSLPALRGVELKRLTVARKDLPANWDQVIRMLADPEGRRNYWE